MKLNKGIMIILLALGVMITAFVAGAIGSKLQAGVLGEMTILPEATEKVR